MPYQAVAYNCGAEPPCEDHIVWMCYHEHPTRKQAKACYEQHKVENPTSAKPPRVGPEYVTKGGDPARYRTTKGEPMASHCDCDQYVGMGEHFCGRMSEQGAESRISELEETLRKIRNLAHLAWTDEKNVEGLFRRIETLAVRELPAGEQE